MRGKRKKDVRARKNDVKPVTRQRPIIEFLKKSVAVALWFMHLRFKTAEGYIKFLQYCCTFLGFGYFGKLFLAEWHKSGPSWPAALILLFGFIFYFSMLSVTQELEIATKLFPPDCVPDELQVKDRFTITIQVTSFLLLYWFLGHAVQYISMASLCMLLIACNDYFTRYQINNKFRNYFANSKYDPFKSDRNYKTIKKRRAVAEWFLFELPHLPKEAGRVIGCAVSFCIATYTLYKDNSSLFSSINSVIKNNGFHLLPIIVQFKQLLFFFLKKHQGDSLNKYAYIILLCTLILNEFITLLWRFKRDARLEKVNLS